MTKKATRARMDHCDFLYAKCMFYGTDGTLDVSEATKH
jgi:hypothetical protein